MYEKCEDLEPDCSADLRPQLSEGNQTGGSPYIELSDSVRAKLVKVDDRMKRRLSRPQGRSATGGPSTDEGRAIASRNALKHGVYAQKILTESESFWELEAAMRSDLKPEGAVESVLLSSGARNLHSLRSIQELKHRRVVVSENTKIDTQELARRVSFPWAQSHHHVLEDPINTPILLRRIQRLWVVLAKPPTATKPNEVMAPADSLVAAIYDRAKAFLVMPTPNPRMDDLFLNGLDLVMLHARDAKNYLGKRVRDEPEHLEILIDYWLYRNASELSMCRHDIQNERTLKLHTDPALSRAESTANKNLRDAMANLSYYRALRPVAGLQTDAPFRPAKR